MKILGNLVLIVVFAYINFEGVYGFHTTGNVHTKCWKHGWPLVWMERHSWTSSGDWSSHFPLDSAGVADYSIAAGLLDLIVLGALMVVVTRTLKRRPTYSIRAILICFIVMACELVVFRLYGIRMAGIVTLAFAGIVLLAVESWRCASAFRSER